MLASSMHELSHAYKTVQKDSSYFTYLPRWPNMVQQQVADNQPLLEAGLDSIGAVELRNSLRSTFGLALPATLVFDHPTIAALAAFCVQMATSAAAVHVVAAASSQRRSQPSSTLTGATVVLSFSCRYPMPCSGASTFWSALSESVDLPQPIPQDRWNIDALYAPEAASGRIYARLAAFLTGHTDFDVVPFGLSRAEAAALDPQSRILLEQTYLALASVRADADSASLMGAGVYIGCMFQEYPSVLAAADSKLSAASATGNSLSFLAGRVSFSFGLTGPCLSTDTACSSSLVATHLGHTDILTGQSPSAVAAGVNLMLSPVTTAAICRLQVCRLDVCSAC